MKKSDIFPSNYVKASDIGDREVTVTISEAKMEKLGEDSKLVVYFQNAEKGLVCNVTNFDRIAYICGSEDTDDWPGHEVVLYTELATFQGKTGPATRVKKPQPKSKPPQRQTGGISDHVVTDRGSYKTMTASRPVAPATADPDDEIPF